MRLSFSIRLRGFFKAQQVAKNIFSSLLHCSFRFVLTAATESSTRKWHEESITTNSRRKLMILPIGISQMYRDLRSRVSRVLHDPLFTFHHRLVISTDWIQQRKGKTHCIAWRQQEIQIKSTSRLILRFHDSAKFGKAFRRIMTIFFFWGRIGKSGRAK